MASAITVHLNKDNSPTWGFRLQGGVDFGTPLIIQKVNSGTPAERAGLIPGDSVIKINNTEVFNLRHKDAQDVVLKAGNNFQMTIQRGGSTWKPQVIPTGSFPTPSPNINNIPTVTKTSLHKQPSENIDAIGTGHNVSAKPFSPQVNGNVNGGPRLVNSQYNSPVKLYSEESIAETLSAQTEVLSTGALGVNFKKNEKDYDASKSAVLRALQESENEPRAPEQEPDSGIVTSPNSGLYGLRHVAAPENKPQPPKPQLPPGQNICADCERLIVGVFVRIKDKNLHVECFKCATCGSSLKNVGYYNINNKLYCDIHAKSAAIAINNPSPNLVPVTVQPGGRIPANAISSALATHSLPTPSPISPKGNSYAAPYQPQENKENDILPTENNNVATEATANLYNNNNNKNFNNNIYNNPTPLPFSKFLDKASNYSTAPKPFSSVSAPLSPPSTLPRGAPLSPRSPTSYSTQPNFSSPVSTAGRYQTQTHKPAGAIFRGRSVSNVVWPPPPEEIELPTACPLYFPPPSQIEAQLLAKKEELAESDYYDEYTEMAAYQHPKMSLCSEEVSSYIERKSAIECIETITETLETQKLVEGIMKTRPKSPPPLGLQIETKIVGDAQCTSGVCSLKQPCPDGTCELRRPSQYEPNTNQCRLPSQITNAVPQAWESQMTQALRTDPFSEIPKTKHSSTAFASALNIAPGVPFTVPGNPLDPVPLPEETVPYFPPEHPIIIDKKEPQPETKKKLDSKSESKFVKALVIAPERPFTPVFTPVGPPVPVYKKKDPAEKFFEDLPKPQERLTMSSALTTASDRPYTPFSESSFTMEDSALKEESTMKYTVDKSTLTKPKMPSQLPESFHPPQREEKVIIREMPPVVIKEMPPIRIEDSEETESKREKDSKHVKIIEKRELKPAVPATITKHRLEEPEPIQSPASFAPIFQGFSCSFQNKTDHSNFSVDIVTTPPVLTPVPEKAKSPKSIIVSEGKSGYIQTEKTIEETNSKQQSSKKQFKHTVASSKPAEIESIVRQAEQVVFKKPMQLSSALHPAQGLPQYQVNLEEEAEAEIKHMERVQKAQVRHEQQKSSHNLHQAPNKPMRAQEPMKKPIITVQPGDHQPATQMSFQPVMDDSRSTSSSRRPVSPSMINKPPSTIPYYQVNLVAHECLAPTVNVLDPKSPAVSRSPSPCPGRERSPSPLPGGSRLSVERPRSPAAGPPPNPLRSREPLPTPRDSRVEHAKQSLSTFIPQYKEKRDLIEKVQGMEFYKRNEDFYSESQASQQVQESQESQTNQQAQTYQNAQTTRQPKTYQKPQTYQNAQPRQQLQNFQQSQTYQNSFASQQPQISLNSQTQDQICTRSCQTCPQAKVCQQMKTCQQSANSKQAEKPTQMYTSQVQTQNYPSPQLYQSSAMSYQESQSENAFQKSLQMQNQQISDSQRSYSSQTGSTTESVSEKAHREQLEEMKKDHSESFETSRSGNVQVQRRKMVTEEYEHSQKQETIEIAKNIITTKIHPFKQVNAPVVDPPGVMGMHLTNPQPISSPFIKSKASGSQGYEPQPQSTPQPPKVTPQHRKSLPTVAPLPQSTKAPAPPIRQVYAPNTQGPVKHVKAPGAPNPSQNVTKPNVPPSTVGAGAGRQSGAVGFAPKRGRGVLNAAAIGGARVPLCGQCHMQIRGPFITALGKIWCPDHFICTTPTCRRPLQDIGFVEERGQLYCEYCFEQYLAPPCSKCSGKIKGDCLKAIGKQFHPECFNCQYCGKLFGNSPFFLEDGAPYCEADWNELFTTKCFACGFPVEAGDRWVEALNNNYHSQCFNCSMCKKNLEGQSFFAKGGRPFCKNHAR